MDDGKTQAVENLVSGRKMLDSTWSRSGMFRPTILGYRKTINGAWKWVGGKHCFGDWVELPIGPHVVPRYLFPIIPNEAQPGEFLETTYRVASHKGTLCVYIPGLDPDSPHIYSMKVLKVCNPLQEREESVARYIADLVHDRKYVDGLMHVRVDDNGQDYKILVAGSYITEDTQQTFCCTQEYDSTVNKWLPVRNPNFEGSLLNDYFQNGANYKPGPKSELLFCISTLDIRVGNRGVLIYDFVAQGWCTCQLPREIAATGKPIGLQPLGVEECGGLIFLFSNERCANGDVNFFIHKLKDIDGAKNVSWEETTWKKRTLNTGDENGFCLYPNTTCVPSDEAIRYCGSCVFAFSLTFTVEKECNDYVSIHGLISDDTTGGLRWGNEIKRYPIRVKPRARDWTDVELNCGFPMFMEQARTKKLNGADMYFFVSKGLWEWGCFYRSPRQCQQRGFTSKRKHKPNQSGSRDSKRISGSEPSGTMTHPLDVEGPGSFSGGPSSPRAAPLAPRAQPRVQVPAANVSFLPIDVGQASLSTAAPQTSGVDAPSATGQAGMPQPSAAVGPPSSSAPATLALSVRPSGEGPSSLNAPCPTSTAQLDSLENTVSELSSGNISSQPYSWKKDFTRAMEVLIRNGKELTELDRGELFRKTVSIDRRKAKNKNENSSDVALSSHFGAVIDELSSFGQVFTTEECLQMLNEALETDDS